MRLLSLLVLILWLPLAAAGQTSSVSGASAGDGFDKAAFDRLLDRAETVLDTGGASTEALEELRMQIVGYRTGAQDRRDAAQVKVAPVQERLNALGDPPAEGETEAEDVAALRGQLQEQIAALSAPVLEADDNFQQADAMIGRIDDVIRSRNTDALLELGPSPFNPARWLEAGQELAAYARSVGHELSATLDSPIRRAARISNLPVFGVMIVTALVLMFRARRWSRRAQSWLSGKASARWTAVYALIGAILQITLPAIGLFLLVQALLLLDLFTLRGPVLVKALGAAGFSLYFATWVTRLLFIPTDKLPALIEVEDRDRRSLRNAFILLGLMFALVGLVEAVGEAGDSSAGLEAATRTLLFPLVMIGGFGLYRIGRILRSYTRSAVMSEGANPFLSRVGTLMGSFCLAAGVLGPVLSAIGYSAAGSRLVFSTGLSLLMIAGFYILFRLLGMMTGALAPAVVSAGAEDESKRYGALFQVTLGFFFICLAVPLLALIWGMRVSELQEIWVWLRGGVAIGDTRFSLTDFLTFILVFSIGYTITRLIQSALRTTVLPNTRLDVGGQNAIVTGTGYVGIFLAALSAIGATGLDLSNLAIVAGALSVGIGFGLQTIVSNFVSGIILLIERPIKEGDWIEVGSYSGYVRKISVRSTEVETFDRASVVIPNADLIAGSVTNWTHSSMAGRVIVPVGVSYDSDPRHVERILREVAEAHPMVILNPPPAIMFIGFGADSLDFQIRAILRDVNWMMSAKSDMNFEIAKRFREEGIEIPFAQRDVFIKNLADLRPGTELPDSRKEDGAQQEGPAQPEEKDTS